MSDCPHGDAAHWPGDAGDVVDSLVFQDFDGDSANPYRLTPHTLWLRILGAIG